MGGIKQPASAIYSFKGTFSWNLTHILLVIQKTTSSNMALKTSNHNYIQLPAENLSGERPFPMYEIAPRFKVCGGSARFILIMSFVLTSNPNVRLFRWYCNRLVVIWGTSLIFLLLLIQRRGNERWQYSENHIKNISSTYRYTVNLLGKISHFFRSACRRQ